MSAVVGWLTLVAAGLGSLVAIAAAVWRIYRFARKVGAGLAELAKLPAAVTKLADELRAVGQHTADRLDQHERRLSALEAGTRHPEGVSP